MTQQRDIERLLDHWFSDGPGRAHDRVIDVVTDRIERQSQRPAWRLHWRPTNVNAYMKIAVAAAAVLVVAVVGYNLLPGRSTGVGGPAPSTSPTGSPSVSATPSVSPSATAAPTTAPTKARASTPALPAPAELQGRWRAEIPPTGDVAILTFTPTTFTISWLGGDTGRIEVEGDEITFRGHPNPECPNGGTYRWLIEGDKLHLEPVGTDPCPFQAEWAGNRTYTRYD